MPQQYYPSPPLTHRALTKTLCSAAPSYVAETLSPTSARRARKNRRAKTEKAGYVKKTRKTK